MQITAVEIEVETLRGRMITHPPNQKLQRAKVDNLQKHQLRTCRRSLDDRDLTKKHEKEPVHGSDHSTKHSGPCPVISPHVRSKG